MFRTDGYLYYQTLFGKFVSVCFRFLSVSLFLVVTLVYLYIRLAIGSFKIILR